MKKYIIIFSLIAMAMSVSSCQKKQAEQPVVEPEVIVEEYQPVHHHQTIDLAQADRYTYFYAPIDDYAQSVNVSYNHKCAYAAPIVITYYYENGDTYTYTIPQDFGLWKNEYGRFRVVTDSECTVWLQGQTKSGKFHELVFYGNPYYDGTKITPNSYINHPKGVIGYRN